MAAIVKVLTPKQHRVVSDLFDDDGIVLLTPTMAEKLSKDLKIRPEELNGLFLPDYDYFGEPDVVFDRVSSEDHLAIDAIRTQLTGE